VDTGTSALYGPGPHPDMDPLRIAGIEWRNMAAWSIQGPALEAVLTEIGCHLAAIRASDGTNPLWQPHWKTANPRTIDPNTHGDYGIGCEAPLLGCIVGHNLCIDRFGEPWPGEGRPMHGEAGVMTWQLAHPSADAVVLEATLPEARLKVRRRLQMEGETIHLTTGVYHAGATDREIEWCEHVTLGDPFLDGALMRAGIDKVFNWPSEAEPGSRFPDASFEAELPVDAALAFPAIDAPPCGDCLTGRVVEGWFSAENPKLKRRLVYRWKPEQFPWLAIWTEHKNRADNPWAGRNRSRGLEISTKPFPEPAPPAARRSSYQGRPSVCRIPANAWYEHELRITWERI
jgi:hypothetical protein